MKTIWMRIKSIFRELFTEATPPAKVETLAEDLRSDDLIHVDKNSEGAIYELAPRSRKIIVACGSCGVRHELNAVCADCGKPLCSDTVNCLHKRYDSRLARYLVVCDSCQ